MPDQYYDVGADELGYDEIGDNGDEWSGEYGALESGALRRRYPGRKRHGRGPLPRPRHANRLMLLPINQTTAINAAALGQATGYPQKVFKPLRLVIGSRSDTVGSVTETITAAGWLINNIQIGATPQAVAMGGIVGDLFLATAVETNFEFDTAQIGHQVVVQVTNNGTIAHPFYGTFVGKAINLPQVL